MSVSLGATPCGSNVPSGSKTVAILVGTQSRNSSQLMRSISRVLRLGALHFLHAKGYGRSWKAQRRALATLMCVPAPQKIILVVRMVIGNANTRVRMRSRFGSDFLG